MINSSIPVTIAGKTFPSVKACCEFFNISSSKVYRYKSANKCTAEEAIKAFLPSELIVQADEIEDKQIFEQALETVEEPVIEEEINTNEDIIEANDEDDPIEEASTVENQSVEEHINEENEYTEVNEEVAKNENNVVTVVAGSDELTHVSEKERTLTLTKVDEKLNIFQKIKRWLFG